jgi:CBS domain containing-hemolysin-like protein
MEVFRKLKTVSMADIAAIEQPESVKSLNLHSPAEEVFTDFSKTTPLMLEQSTPIDEAVEMMKRSHVKLKLVIDSRELFRGVISLADLLSVKTMRAAQSTGMRRDELTVAHVMTRREDMHAISIKSLSSARIGDLLATMETFGDQHVLVVDPDARSIRGMISARDIARRLHIPVSINARANSFAEVYQAVRA